MTLVETYGRPENKRSFDMFWGFSVSAIPTDQASNYFPCPQRFI